MQIVEYIKPELLVVSAVLYFLNRMIKQSRIIDCRYIPLINCVAGIFICGSYVVSVSPITTSQRFSLALFTAITQGILVAGISTYAYKVFTSDGKIDLKGAFSSAGDGQDEDSQDDGPGCDLKCTLKHEITSNIKHELISELEDEIIHEIEDELLSGIRSEESKE